MGREIKRVDPSFDWQAYDPERDEGTVPDGPGWQMWDTVGSRPISPVFSTPEKLAQWLLVSRIKAAGANTATFAEWLAAIRAGWVPSYVNGVTGVAHAYMVEQRKKKAKEEEKALENSIQPCPFCGSTDAYSGFFDCDPYERYYVECALCEARGPLKSKKANAIKAWNEREEK